MICLCVVSRNLYTTPLNTFLEWSPLECLIYSTNFNPFLAVVLMVKLLEFGVGHCYMHVTLKANFFLSSKNLFSFGGLVWFLFVIKFQPGCYKKHFIFFPHGDVHFTATSRNWRCIQVEMIKKNHFNGEKRYFKSFFIFRLF